MQTTTATIAAITQTPKPDISSSLPAAAFVGVGTTPETVAEHTAAEQADAEGDALTGGLVTVVTLMQPLSYWFPAAKLVPVWLLNARRMRLWPAVLKRGQPRSYLSKPEAGSRAKAAQAPRMYLPTATCSGVWGAMPRSSVVLKIPKICVACVIASVLGPFSWTGGFSYSHLSHAMLRSMAWLLTAGWEILQSTDTAMWGCHLALSVLPSSLRGT